MIERRDSADLDPAPQHLIQPDGVGALGVEEVAEIGVDVAIQVGLENTVLPMRIVGLAPQPFTPRLEIVPVLLAGLLLHELEDALVRLNARIAAIPEPGRVAAEGVRASAAAAAHHGVAGIHVGYPAPAQQDVASSGPARGQKADPFQQHGRVAILPALADLLERFLGGLLVG